MLKKAAKFSALDSTFQLFNRVKTEMLIRVNNVDTGRVAVYHNRHVFLT